MLNDDSERAEAFARASRVYERLEKALNSIMADEFMKKAVIDAYSCLTPDARREIQQLLLQRLQEEVEARRSNLKSKLGRRADALAETEDV